MWPNTRYVRPIPDRITVPGGCQGVIFRERYRLLREQVEVSVAVNADEDVLGSILARAAAGAWRSQDLYPLG